jgi:hypothetical protein
MGFKSILKKVLPHVPQAISVIEAAKEGGATGAAVAVVTEIMHGAATARTTGDRTADAITATAAAVDDHERRFKEQAAELDRLKKLVEQLSRK